MTALTVVILQTLCCLGLGATLLSALKLAREHSPIERLTWSFALGFGLLGWILFWFGVLGWFTAAAFWPLLIAGALGCWFLRDIRPSTTGFANDRWQVVLVLALLFALGLDFLEALAPPADGDSIAYHFALPKEFAALGRLEFVPRAVDGAIPLLVQMTYVPALALGAERALTFWTLVSSWAAVGLAFGVARRFLDARWSLAVALLLATTPAVVYGGGSGQVEMRSALFATLAAIALSEAVRVGDWRYTVIAGLGIGFFMGSKYTGLLFALSCGLAMVAFLIAYRGKLIFHGTILTGTAIVAGFEWYMWNWINTGDPVFPVLYGLVDYVNTDYWDAAHQQYLRQSTAAGERAVPVDLLWFVAYPFVATIKGLPVFESGRTGLGPFALLVLPMGLLALVTKRKRVLSHPLLIAAVVAALFYAIWFFSGFSQRIRHLLPIYPIVLICLMTAAKRWAEMSGGAKPLAMAALLTCGVQFGGHLVFTRNFAEYALTSENRDQFLARNLWGYEAVQWINQNLGQGARIYVPIRTIVYHIDVPTYYAHPVQDARIDIRPDAHDPERFFRQLRKQGITDLLVYDEEESQAAVGMNQWRPFTSSGCLERVKQFSVDVFQSRTLPALARRSERWGVYHLDTPACAAIVP